MKIVSSGFQTIFSSYKADPGFIVWTLQTCSAKKGGREPLNPIFLDELRLILCLNIEFEIHK